MIDTLTPTIRALIIDMDGVLWRDKQPLADLPAFFNGLAARGLKFILATNNATRSPRQIQDKLLGYGVSLPEQQIVTSSMAVTYMLKQRFPQGGPVFVVGEVGLSSTLQDGGFFLAEQDVLAVVAGLDRQLTYDKINHASRLIRQGAAFYGTNPDATFPIPEGLAPGAGTVLAAIQTASGTQPVIAGKPQPGMFTYALALLETDPQETLVVGDRLDTDIQGGQIAGCRTALILSGVTTSQELEAWQPKPDLVLENVADLIK